MGSTKNFFNKKKKWSELKDGLLSYYLTPYVAKLLTAKRPLYIIDCFAGKGKFDDGSTGSPIIIAEKIQSVIYKQPNSSVHGIFIEKKYSDHLINNLSNYKNCRVLKGTFEDHLNTVLNISSNSSLFFYIDPYGIKNLDFNRFSKIKNRQFRSVEMLLNFNSFGFLREGCRLLKYNKQYNELDAEDDYEQDNTNTIENMNLIANGDYWINILEDYSNEKMSMFEAEEIFVKHYVDKLRAIFQYVVNIPIKTRIKNIPKYRLLFGTNNKDGLILMAENMNKKWLQILDEDRNGQLVLFENDFPDIFLRNGFDLESDLIKYAQNKILLKDVIVKAIEKYGICFAPKDYVDELKKLEGMKITVDREPNLTRTGLRAKTWNYNDHNYKIYIQSQYNYIGPSISR
jgi:three-Cys-motif partner protein